MSFTTLTAVNFVFVRIETRDGLVGWGEAACLGGPTWSEESAESISATLERYVAALARRARRHADRGAAAGDGASGCRAIRSRAPPSRWRCGTSTAARSASPSIACSAAASATACRCRGRSPCRVRDAELAEAREKVAKGHRIFKIKTAAHPVAEDVARVRADPRGRRARRAAARRRQSGLGPADRAASHPGHGALRSGLRRAAGAALGPRRPGRDRAQRDGADHGRRVVRLAAGRAGHRPARRRVDPGAQAHQVGGAGAHHGHRAHRRGRRPRLLRRLHDRDFARHRRLSAGRAGGRAGDLGLRAVRSAPARGRRGARARCATPTVASSPSTAPASASRSTRPR